jgi:hypothetical protein
MQKTLQKHREREQEGEREREQACLCVYFLSLILDYTKLN